jgi:hypothetical protein
MEIEKNFKTKKRISMLCLVFLIALFACNWIVAIDEDSKEKISVAIERLETAANIDEDYAEGIDALSQEAGSDFSMRQFKKSAGTLFAIFEDMKISLFEMPGMILPSLNMIRLIDGNHIGELFGIDSESFGIILIFSCINTFILVLTILIIILYLVLHFFNGDGIGIPVLILYLLNYGTMLLSSYIINVNFTNDIMERVVRVSIIPYIGLIVLIISFIVWKGAVKNKALLDKSTCDVDTNMV